MQQSVWGVLVSWSHEHSIRPASTIINPVYCPGPVAFVPNFTNDINLCDVFWSLPADGELSVTHVLIYEVGHVVGMTDWGSTDETYREHAEWWAANVPWIAQQNSENYALFIMDPP